MTDPAPTPVAERGAQRRVEAQPDPAALRLASLAQGPGGAPAPAALRLGFASLRDRAGRAARVVAAALAPAGRVVRRAVGPVLAVVTPTGLVVAGVAALVLVVGIALGWQELVVLGAVLAAALLVAVAFLFGRASYGVLIELAPRRVVVGDRAMGRMLVTNTGRRALAPSRMELPVGRGLAEFSLPAMQPAQQHEELFAVPTHRRAVIQAGPAESVKGDAIGLLRRAQQWSEPVELFVHPRTVRLAPSAAGLVRDLEGQTSKRITNTDLAFHALRPYEPGDDRRYVHWRTSARIGQLMVRQFEETRRSQITVVHVSMREAYRSDDEFELAVSVTASIAAQVIRDGTRIDVVSGRGLWRTRGVTAMLDDSCREELEPVPAFGSVRALARERTRRLPAPSVVMVVGGSGLEAADFRSVHTLFGPDTTHVAIRVDLGAPPRLSVATGRTRIDIGALEDLPALLREVTS